jgi:hypothetical protein
MSVPYRIVRPIDTTWRLHQFNGEEYVVMRRTCPRFGSDIIVRRLRDHAWVPSGFRRIWNRRDVRAFLASFDGELAMWNRRRNWAREFAAVGISR